MEVAPQGQMVQMLGVGEWTLVVTHRDGGQDTFLFAIKPDEEEKDQVVYEGVQYFLPANAPWFKVVEPGRAMIYYSWANVFAVEVRVRMEGDEMFASPAPETEVVEGASNE